MKNLSERQWALTDEIMSLKLTTLASLAVMARAVIISENNRWTDKDKYVLFGARNVRGGVGERGNS